MSTLPPDNSTIALYKKSLTESGAVDMQAGLKLLIDGHIGGRVNAECTESFLILARGDNPEVWGDEPKEPVVTNGATPPKVKVSDNPYSGDNPDAARIAKLIASEGTAKAASYARLAGKQVNGKPIRA